MTVDCNRMLKNGAELEQNVYLQEGDIVYVPPTVLGWIGLRFRRVALPGAAGRADHLAAAAIGRARGGLQRSDPLIEQTGSGPICSITRTIIWMNCSVSDLRPRSLRRCSSPRPLVVHYSLLCRSHGGLHRVACRAGADSTQTLFERRNDPVLAGLLGQRWTQPYEEQRGRINADLKDRAGIVEVLASLDLPKGLKRFPDGNLTPDAVKVREHFADEIGAGLTATFIESSANRDVVELDALPMAIKLTCPRFCPPFATVMSKLPASKLWACLPVLDFFQSEAERSTGALRDLERKLAEAEQKHPGVNPDAFDPIESERTRFDRRTRRAPATDRRIDAGARAGCPNFGPAHGKADGVGVRGGQRREI